MHNIHVTTVSLASFSLSLIKFLLSLSLRICLNWSMFSLLAVLDPRLLSPYPDHLLPHHSKLQTVLFNIQNKLPHSFREPHPQSGLSPSHNSTQIGSTLSSPPLSPSITPSLFHSRLKTHLFLKSFPP